MSDRLEQLKQLLASLEPLQSHERPEVHIHLPSDPEALRALLEAVLAYLARIV